MARHRPSLPVAASAVIGLASGIFALLIHAPSVRVVGGALLLTTLWVATVLACRARAGPSTELADHLLLGLGLAVGIALFTMLLLGLFGELTRDSALLAVMILVVLAASAAGHHHHSLQESPIRVFLVTGLSPRVFATAGLLGVALVLGVAAVLTNVQSFRNDQRPLAALDVSQSVDGSPILSVKNLSTSSEVASLTEEAAGSGAAPIETTLRLKPGETYTARIGVPAALSRIVASLEVAQGGRITTYKLNGYA